MTVLSIVIVVVYCVATLALSLWGMKKTKNLASFARGNGDMSPWLVGLTMSSSIASTATFVINPGFVYTHGLSALGHFGIGAMDGLALALIVFSKGFHAIAKDVDAMTLPDWVKKRFGSDALGKLFAVLSLFYVSFLVLILAGSAMIIEGMFGVSYHVALVSLLVFTFSYVLLGGTYAHAYTNALQGGLMLLVCVVLLASGARFLDDEGFANLTAAGPTYLSWVNPESSLYNGFFAVFGASFIVTFALMLQPHILTKVLYIKNKDDVPRFLAIAIGTSVVFASMLVVGLIARMAGIEGVAQDQVVIAYVNQTLPPLVQSLVLVTLLAAGMSTLDGILVAVSTVVVHDLVVAPMSARAPAERARWEARGIHLSRFALVALGVVTLAIAWDPPKLLGLFAQTGVYGFVAASAPPLVVGVLFPWFRDGRPLFGLATAALAIHFGLRFAFGVENPAVSAGVAIVSTTAAAMLFAIVRRPRTAIAPILGA